jgi:hypothetical protein
MITENSQTIVRVQDPKTITCLHRLSKLRPRPYTKFILSKPAHKNKKWGIRSYVDYELIEEDGAVVILLQKGLTVDESNYALWSVATLLLEASEKTKAAKKQAAMVVANKAGGLVWVMFWVKHMGRYLTDIASRLFNLPTELYYKVQRFFQRRR